MQNTIEIIKLDENEYKGRKFTLTYTTKGYLDIVPSENGFQIIRKTFDEEREMSFDDMFFNDWLDDPIAYGAFLNGELVGYVEGTPERWNNRYRISNICIFDDCYRHTGIGSLLMNTILDEAERSGARMVVLETQTCNEKAIAFYRKNGFDIIGFDLFAYTNTDSERQEVRIEMGKKLS